MTGGRFVASNCVRKIEAESRQLLQLCAAVCFAVKLKDVGRIFLLGVKPETSRLKKRPSVA